jgi:hypothetical protein
MTAIRLLVPLLLSGLVSTALSCTFSVINDNTSLKGLSISSYNGWDSSCQDAYESNDFTIPAGASELSKSRRSVDTVGCHFRSLTRLFPSTSRSLSMATHGITLAGALDCFDTSSCKFRYPGGPQGCGDLNTIGCGQNLIFASSGVICVANAGTVSCPSPLTEAAGSGAAGSGAAQPPSRGRNLLRSRGRPEEAK